MSQDGSKGPAQAKTFHSTGDPSATVLLTLCLSSSSNVVQQHATVPYPASYEDACRKALNVFAAYLPAKTIAVALRRASKRADGTHVWSIVEEDDWECVVQRSGEEIGVFLPDNSAGTMSYSQGITTAPKKFVQFYMRIEVIGRPLEFNEMYEMMVVNSFEDCKQAAGAFLGAISTSQVTLSFDKRMFGTTKGVADYKNNSREGSGYTQHAIWTLIHNEETFELLFERNPCPERPVWIKAGYIDIPWTK